MARRPRGLTEDDQRLWNKIASSTNPLDKRGRPKSALPTRTDPPPAIRHAKPETPVLDSTTGPHWRPVPFDIGAGSAAAKKTAPALPAIADDLAQDFLRHARELRMDARANRKLRKGKLTPEARIDLHGMTLATAQPALHGFIMRSRASGKRLVLVITGKGLGSRPDPAMLDDQRGVLRQQVPHWLHMAPIGDCVAQVVPAHARHGGGGAFYVWLRKARR